MPFPLDSICKDTIINYFKKRKIGFDENSLIEVLKSSTKKYDIYWAVIGLRDVGTEKCIPYLRALRNFPMQDVKDCLLLTISHIAGEKETNFYVSVLQEKGTKKDYPMWAIKDSANEQAINPVIEYLLSLLKKFRRPQFNYYGSSYIDGLIYLSKYKSTDTRIKEIFDNFIEIQGRLPQGAKETLKNNVEYFKERIR